MTVIVRRSSPATPLRENLIGIAAIVACNLVFLVNDTMLKLVSVHLPLGVVRILIADLREHGLVNVRQPAPSGLSDIGILKEVANALRRL